MSVHLTSSKSLDGVSGVASEIQKEKKVAYAILLKNYCLHTSAKRLLSRNVDNMKWCNILFSLFGWILNIITFYSFIFCSLTSLSLFFCVSGTRCLHSGMCILTFVDNQINSFLVSKDIYIASLNFLFLLNSLTYLNERVCA